MQGNLGSISAALSSPVFVPPREESFRGRSAGLFPEQRLEIEPMGNFDVTLVMGYENASRV